jgi:LmbE family N-acetylglucosaminyl deacetylase
LLVVLSLAALFVATGSSPGATASCPVGASMQIVAHPDDDLLFQSPDLLHDVQAGKCVRTVFVTAGTRDDTDLMLMREAGMKAAYANMAGVADSWTTADAGISGHPMPLSTLSGKPTVSLVFMRLPEGFWGAGGTLRDETLKNLWQGSISQIHAEDGTSAYTSMSLTTTLTALMTAFQPDTIRTQDYVGTFGDGDHDDHHAASYYARNAHKAYTTSHTFIGYQDYETEDEPQNVSGADLTAKTNAFYTYLQFDEAPCGSPPNCGNNEFSLWLKRQYVKGTESGTDTTPPTVSAVTPASGAQNVSLGTSVSATFSESISAASVTGTSFVLREGGGNAVAASVSASGSTATLQPSASLQPSTTYTATLSGGSSGIKDLAGNALASNFSWSFTTVAPDTTPPTVSAVTPASGAQNVSLGTSVSATFSESISAASVTGTSFVLREGGGNAVAASVSASGSTATLQPSASLQPSTTYTATLSGGSSGIKDLAGNALAADYTWSFTTVTVDTTPPTSAVAFPADSGSYNSAGWNAGCTPSGICGSASDGGSGVQKVELSIRRLSNGRYWNGTGFNSTTELWVVATGTTSWRYGLTASGLAAGSYTVRVRATDNSANVSTPSSTAFVYDNTNPSSTVTFPVANTSYTSATWNAGCAVSGVCGTASDATSGVKRVEVSIRRGSTTYWNGTSFSSTTEIFLPATGTTSWSFAFAASNFPAAANYRIRVRATDNAGNVQSPSTRTITFSP